MFVRSVVFEHFNGAFENSRQSDAYYNYAKRYFLMHTLATIDEADQSIDQKKHDQHCNKEKGDLAIPGVFPYFSRKLVLRLRRVLERRHADG